MCHLSPLSDTWHSVKTNLSQVINCSQEGHVKSCGGQLCICKDLMAWLKSRNSQGIVNYKYVGPWCHAWNQKDARFGVNSQSVMPSDPTFHFRIYVYIRLIVTKLGILKGMTSHSHTITNIHCKCSVSMYLAHYSTDLLCSTCKITLKK